MDFTSAYDALSTVGEQSPLNVYLLEHVPPLPLTAAALEGARADCPAALLEPYKVDGVQRIESVALVRGEVVFRNDTPFPKTLVARGLYVTSTASPVGIVGVCEFGDQFTFDVPMQELHINLACLAQRLGLGA